MPAATATAIIGGLGVANSIYQTIDGSNRKNDAQNALNKYERQDLDNAFSDIQIPMAGIDLARDNYAGTQAALIENARNGGIRGINGSIPQITANSNRMNAEARAYIDDMINRRQYAVAGDNANIRGMQERREEGDLAGLGQAIQTGRQDMWNGLRGITSSGAYIANNPSAQQRNDLPVDTLSGMPQVNTSQPSYSAPQISERPQYDPFANFSNFNFGF